MKTTLLKYALDKQHDSPRQSPDSRKPVIATRHLARVGRQVVTRWRVDITLNERKASPNASIADWLTNTTTTSIAVVAPTAFQALDWALEQTRGIPCREIEVYGPRGGVAAHSYRGWESAIGELMFAPRPTTTQLSLL